jgi:hypothetical protein
MKWDCVVLFKRLNVVIKTFLESNDTHTFCVIELPEFFSVNTLNMILIAKYSMTTFWLGVQYDISEYICQHELYPGFFFFFVFGFFGFSPFLSWLVMENFRNQIVVLFLHKICSLYFITLAYAGGEQLTITVRTICTSNVSHAYILH